VTGQTDSPNFPTTPGAFQRAFAGSSDAFVAKISHTPTKTENEGHDNDDYGNDR